MTKPTTIRLPDDLAADGRAVARVCGGSANQLNTGSLAAEIERVRRQAAVAELDNWVLNIAAVVAVVGFVNLDQARSSTVGRDVSAAVDGKVSALFGVAPLAHLHRIQETCRGAAPVSCPAGGDA